MKFIKKVLGTLVLLILLAIAVGGYLGLVPWVSGIFGSDKPRELSAAHTSADMESAQKKFNQTIVEVGSDSPNEVLRKAKPTAVEAQFSGKEFAAHIDFMHPIKEVQVIFHDDGTFEASGRIEKDRIIDYARLLGYTEEEIAKADVADKINEYIPGEPVFYLKGTGWIEDDKPFMSLEKAELGRLPIPASRSAELLEQYAGIVLERVPGLSVSELRIEKGQLKFIGTAPRQFPRW